MEIEVLERAAGYAVVACDRVLLLVWRGASTGRGIDRLHALVHARVAARPGGVVFLNVVAQQADRPPDEGARAAMRQAVKDRSPGLLGLGTIHEGGGFKGAFVRALISSLQRTQGWSVPMRVFRSPDEAAPWVAGLLRGPEITGHVLAEAIRVGRED
jgi:hypothetical protein